MLQSTSGPTTQTIVLDPQVSTSKPKNKQKRVTFVTSNICTLSDLKAQEQEQQTNRPPVLVLRPPTGILRPPPVAIDTRGTEAPSAGLLPGPSTRPPKRDRVEGDSQAEQPAAKRGYRLNSFHQSGNPVANAINQCMQAMGGTHNWVQAAAYLYSCLVSNDVQGIQAAFSDSPEDEAVVFQATPQDIINACLTECGLTTCLEEIGNIWPGFTHNLVHQVIVNNPGAAIQALSYALKKLVADSTSDRLVPQQVLVVVRAIVQCVRLSQEPQLVSIREQAESIIEHALQTSLQTDLTKAKDKGRSESGSKGKEKAQSLSPLLQAIKTAIAASSPAGLTTCQLAETLMREHPQSTGLILDFVLMDTHRLANTKAGLKQLYALAKCYLNNPTPFLFALTVHSNCPGDLAWKMFARHYRQLLPCEKECTLLECQTMLNYVQGYIQQGRTRAALSDLIANRDELVATIEYCFKGSSSRTTLSGALTKQLQSINEQLIQLSQPATPPPEPEEVEEMESDTDSTDDYFDALSGDAPSLQPQ